MEVCKLDPVVFYSEYTRVKPEMVKTIVNQYLVEGKKVSAHCYPPESVEKK